jgi:hypothetical protein
MSMIKWIRTSRFSIKNSLSAGGGSKGEAEGAWSAARVAPRHGRASKKIMTALKGV